MLSRAFKKLFLSPYLSIFLPLYEIGLSKVRALPLGVAAGM